MMRRVFVLSCSLLTVAQLAFAQQIAAPGPSSSDILRTDLQNFVQSGDTNAALARVLSAIDDPVYGDVRDGLLSFGMDLYVGLDQLSTARDFFVSTTAAQPEIWGAGYRPVYHALRGMGRDLDLAEWGVGLLGTSSLLPEARAVMIAQSIDRFAALNQTNRFDAAARDALGALEGAALAPAFSQVISGFKGEQLAPWVDRLIAVIENTQVEDAALVALVGRAHFDRAIRASDWTRAEVLLKGLADDQDEAEQRLLATRLVREATLAGAFEIAQRVGASAGGLTDIFWLARVDRVISATAWDEADAVLNAALAHVPDAQLGGRITRLARAMKQAETVTKSDALLTDLLPKVAAANLAQTYRALVRAWVAIPRDQGQDRETVARLLKLEKRGGHPDALGAAYVESFYTIAKGEDQRLVRALFDLADRTRENMSTVQSEQLVHLMLDASFLLEDYALSLKVIDGGIPGVEDERLSFMRNKVLAHKAEADGDYKEAARRYRIFMAEVAEKEKTVHDPTRNESVQVSEILGLNAARIGRLLKQARDKRGSRKAYAEARTHYETALGLVEEDSAPARRIRAALADVPR